MHQLLGMRAALSGPRDCRRRRRSDDPARALRRVRRVRHIVRQLRATSCATTSRPCWTLLASGRPVVAVLASEYVAALHPLTPAEVERDARGDRLRRGRDDRARRGARRRRLRAGARRRADDALPRLRSTCPVVGLVGRALLPAAHRRARADRAALHRAGAARSRDLPRGHRDRLRVAVLGAQERDPRPAVRRCASTSRSASTNSSASLPSSPLRLSPPGLKTAAHPQAARRPRSSRSPTASRGGRSSSAT